MWSVMLGREGWSHTPYRVLSDRMTLFVSESGCTGGSSFWHTGHMYSPEIHPIANDLYLAVEKW